MSRRLRRLAAGLGRAGGSFRANVTRVVALRIAGAAVATGGVALMGFGTIGTPVVSLASNVAAPIAPVTSPLIGSGNKNKEDVWVDNVGKPPGPGHEQDPHLLCEDINIWAVALEDAAGTYTIDGWPPSGRMEQDYPASGSNPWTYNTSAGGDQVVSVIDVDVLIANAIANGDTPQPQQGFHFKLQFTQDPQKHKTFWVNCPGPTTTTTTTTTSTTTPSTTTSTTSSSTSSTSSTTSSTSSTTSSTTTTTTTTTTTPTTTTTTTTTSPSTTTPTTTTTTTTTTPSTTTVASGPTTTTPTTETSGTSEATSTTAAAGVGVLGTSTPGTGAGGTTMFGLGLGLLIGGSALVFGAGPLLRRKRS